MAVTCSTRVFAAAYSILATSSSLVSNAGGTGAAISSIWGKGAAVLSARGTLAGKSSSAPWGGGNMINRKKHYAKKLTYVLLLCCIELPYAQHPHRFVRLLVRIKGRWKMCIKCLMMHEEQKQVRGNDFLRHEANSWLKLGRQRSTVNGRSCCCHVTEL